MRTCELKEEKWGCLYSQTFSFQVVTFDTAGPEDEAFDTDSHNLLVHFMNNDAETLYRMN